MKHEDNKRATDWNKPEAVKKQIAMKKKIIEAELEAGRIRTIKIKLF